MKSHPFSPLTLAILAALLATLFVLGSADFTTKYHHHDIARTLTG